MRLASFILRDMDVILAQWEAFAARLPAAANQGPLALRDYSQSLLEAIATDLSTSQTGSPQLHEPVLPVSEQVDAPQTAAQLHAVLRAQQGFDINQLAAEYRALRACVLRLWLDDCKPETPSLDDIIRFNEAIDQAIAEAIRSFSAQVEQSRNLFLGMLGHDMRSPLQTIKATASYLATLNAGGGISTAASRLMKTGARMQALLDDLCDYNRTRLGLGINIAPADIDLVAVLADEVDQLRAAHPDHPIALEAPVSLRGVWDGPRLQQVLCNLILNAIKYGAPGAPVRVVVTDDGTGVIVDVKNAGVAVDPAVLQTIFDPLCRGRKAADRQGDSLGLGLYIAREIAIAHGGGIDVRSGEKETVFTVRLPRQAVIGQTA